MKLMVVKDYEQVSLAVADCFAQMLQAKPNAVLGLATGTTPLRAYEILVEQCQKGELSFSQVTTFNLDEYRGLSADSPASYRYFMNEHLFSHIDIDKQKTYIPEGSNLNSAQACAAYDRLLAEFGPIDMQLLGIGRNGHIGFNEPSDAFSQDTHCVDLTESTIEANSRLFARQSDVPRQAYTMGVKSIMQARRIVLAASGEDKAQAVQNAVQGPIKPQCPASALQLHRHCTIIADEAAAALL